MAKSKTNEDEGKPLFPKNEIASVTLKKHMEDWFQNHRNEAFITPVEFQNLYPMYEKYDSKSFRIVFYKFKKKIQTGE